MELILSAPFAKHFDRLVELARSGMSELESDHGEMFEELNLRTPPHALRPDFIRIATRFEGDEAARFMASYHAYHHVTFNEKWISGLREAMTSPSRKSRKRVLKRYFILAELSLREMAMAYMAGLFRLYLGHEESNARFVMMNVGNLSDTEDIDVAAILYGVDSGSSINRAMAKVARQFMINYSPLHFYLNELMPLTRYLARIEDFKRLQDRELRNVVVLSQLSTASRLAGSPELASQFTKTLTGKYYFKGRVTKHHEGFVRGAIREVGLWLEMAPDPEIINPKRDALRLLYLIVSAAKSIHCVNDLNVLRSISHLRRADPGYESAYKRLEKSGAFICVFRYLANLLVSREGVIIPGEEFSTLPLDFMADVLALDGGPDEIEEKYHKHVNSIRKASKKLYSKLVGHVKEHGLLRRLEDRWTDKTPLDKLSGNIALVFANAMQRFHREVFWEDVSELFRESPQLMERFTNDLESLEDPLRKKVVSRYSKMLAASGPYGFIEFITALSKPDSTQASDLARAYVKRLKRSGMALEKFVLYCFTYPREVKRLIDSIDDKAAAAFIRLVSKEKTDPRYLRVRARFRLNLFATRLNSRFFEQRLIEAQKMNPDIYKEVDQFEKLKMRTNRIHAMVGNPDGSEDAPTLILMLRRAFAHEYVASAFMEIAGVKPEFVNERFTKAFDTFINGVVFTMAPIGGNWAIFASGSAGRGDAFYKDFDCIALAGDDEALKELGKIVRNLGRHIQQAGILPHYHAVEMAGEWAMTPGQIVHLIEKDGVEKRFVDLAELVSARLITGNKELYSKLEKQVLKRFIFSDPRPFVNALTRELRSRWDEESRSLNPKEAPGGLRDINLIAHLIRALLNREEICPIKLFDAVIASNPSFKGLLQTLKTNMISLRRFRNIFRLAVAFDDEMVEDHLGPVAILEGIKKSRELEKTLNTTLDDNVNIMSDLLKHKELAIQ